MAKKTAIVQQITEPFDTLEEALDNLASLKYIPGHIFSYLIPSTLQCVVLGEVLTFDGASPVKGQVEVMLGEPILAGLCPPAHALSSITLKVEEYGDSGEFVGTHAVTIPLSPNIPVNPLGPNRILVTVDEHVVPTMLVRHLINRKIGVEIYFPEGKIGNIRGPREALKFVGVTKIETAPGYPHPPV